MKFENNRIRIIIEKKQLTEEQKAAAKLCRKKRLPAAALVFVLIAAIGGGILYTHIGADGAVEHMAEGTYVSASKLAAGIQKKYAADSLYNYTYGEPIADLGRKEAIEIKVEYNPEDLELEKWTEVCAVYQNPELTHLVATNFNMDKDKGIISITPPNYASCTVSTFGLSTETVNKYAHSAYTFFDEGIGTTWGNLGTLYMASYRDKNTGEPLETPEVSIITLRGELEDAPKLSFSIAEDGRAAFEWSAVEGADAYMVCKTVSGEDRGYEGGMTVLGTTGDTAWSAEMPEFTSTIAYTNKEFKYFDISEDDWKDEDSLERNKEKSEEIGKAYRETEPAEEYGICVIALNKDGTSMISNVYEYSEIVSNLPYKTATYTADENGFKTNYASIDDISIYGYVTMCDGATNAKLINYKTENAMVKDERFFSMDDDGEINDIETVTCLNIPYVIEGTPFSYVISIEDYDENNLEKDLTFLEEREEKLRQKSGDVKLDFDLQLASADEKGMKKIREVENTKIFANSALTEYLALGMLGGSDIIDLSEFPEARDIEFVYDALMEAYYQNPLILGIEGYRVSKRGTAVRIAYEETSVEQARKQNEIQQKVEEVIDNIITNNMTAQEKELAINQYLCDTITYDDAALENAEKNDFQYVDSEYNDSFNAYGALINEECVCAGYAAAFKLLADEAGLESIVVTGFLEGSLAHAWNKVNIDGEWQIVDVTNNDNEYFFNALLNLPASVGNKILVEDKEYVLDKVMTGYTGISDDNEYYHLTDSYFPAGEIAEQLTRELEEKGEAVLRTDYELNDNQFYEVTDAIFEIMGDDVELSGYYWLGVIYLAIESST